MTNRLAGAASDYLRQHADNPVDWWPWGPDAFAEARRRDVPVLLSVGYAACHWCHVMAHESFEDPALAAQLNRGFVAVKVDREERPDVDAVYMAATQATTGQGGWPMTCFLTPDARPFLCGTYHPPTRRHGMPGFGEVLDAVAQAWAERRGELLTGAAQLTAHLAEVAVLAGPDGPRPPDAELLRAAVAGLVEDFDDRTGGFGTAPKFPPSMVAEFLLRHHARTGSPDARRMLDHTCVAMASGGLYDQLGGGFARYSVDADWVVPHFEKMLYDNAQLLRLYTHWNALAPSPLGERVVRETAGFLLRDLLTTEGGFASALDADAAGVEGSTYVWTPAELDAVLGPQDGAWAARLYRVGPAGTFEGPASTLQRAREEPDTARVESVRARLLAARALRPQPARDEKVVTAWNGLAIGALAEAGAALAEPSWVAAAVRCAELLAAVHRVPGRPGRLLRTSRDGVAGPAPAVLEDAGCLAEGWLVLAAVTGDPVWAERAGELLDAVLDHFADADGVLHDTADDAEALITRPREPADNASPSGTSAVAGALLSHGALTGSARHLDAADRALAAARVLAGRAPRFAGWGLAVLEARVDGPRQVAVVGSAGDPDRAALHREALAALGRGAVVALGGTGPDGAPVAGGLPLLEDRPAPAGRATAYVCRGFVCDLPVGTVEALRRQLAPVGPAG